MSIIYYLSKIKGKKVNYNKRMIPIFFILACFFSTYVIADTAITKFQAIDKTQMGEAVNMGQVELVDTWFLQLPAFKFSLYDFDPGAYILALHLGSSCSKRGPTLEKVKKELKIWNPENLFEIEVPENGYFDTTLIAKPDAVTSKTKNLITVTTMRGQIITIRKQENDKIYACGKVPEL